MRVSTAEREAAVERLTEQWHSGRLDPAEHELRITRARDAVTRADLDVLFTDLAPARAEPVHGEVLDNKLGGRQTGVSAGLYKAVTALAAVSPFLSVALFFLFKNWVWFMLVPASWALRSSLSPEQDESRASRDERRRERRGRD